MHYEFPLVFFTVLTQLSVGLAIVAAMKTCAAPAVNSAASLRMHWFLSLLAGGLGVLASLFHLGDPWRAYTALNNLSVSWLSREGLVFGTFCVLVYVNVLVRNRALAVGTALVGMLGIAMQGFTYAPVALPAVSNGFPLLFFALATTILGAGFGRVQGFSLKGWLRGATACLILLLLVVPCIWASGSAVMRDTALAWLNSWPFWLGMAFLLAGLLMSFRKKSCSCTDGVVLLGGIILTRMAFFADTIHTASRLGMPY